MIAATASLLRFEIKEEHRHQTGKEWLRNSFQNEHEYINYQHIFMNFARSVLVQSSLHKFITIVNNHALSAFFVFQESSKWHL